MFWKPHHCPISTSALFCNTTLQYIRCSFTCWSSFKGPDWTTMHKEPPPRCKIHSIFAELCFRLQRDWNKRMHQDGVGVLTPCAVCSAQFSSLIICLFPPLTPSSQSCNIAITKKVCLFKSNNLNFYSDVIVNFTILEKTMSALMKTCEYTLVQVNLD